MSENKKLATIKAMVAEAGYEVTEEGGNLLSIRDPNRTSWFAEHLNQSCST